MKSFIMKVNLIVTIGLVSCNAQAQKGMDRVPPPVLTAFSTSYPQAKLKNWRISKDTCIASFKLANRKYQVFYLQDGDWLRSERIIRHEISLPESAQLFLKKGKYANWYIEDLKNVKTPSESLYIVSIDNNSGNAFSYENYGAVESKRLYFNTSGKLVKVTKLE